jgi:micrococcal nuclease
MQRLIGYAVIGVALGLGVLSLTEFFLTPSFILQPVTQLAHTHPIPPSASPFVPEEREEDLPVEEGDREDIADRIGGDMARERLKIQEETDSYRVTKVVDGDTVDVSMNGKTERVRVIGMDTPETKDTRTTVECFGREASARAAELLQGKDVFLETDESQDDRDKYKRLLRHLFIDGGEGGRANFALEMIADGYAFEYTYDVPSRYQQEYRAAEREARVRGKGLWSARTCNGKHQPASQTGSGGVKP